MLALQRGFQPAQEYKNYSDLRFFEDGLLEPETC
tara:strand:- start:324 stop:425 length:102 start_codon:yes stop_codon:yes gene_type:complete